MRASIIKKINKFLLNEWDPIGIRKKPDAKDEYSQYAQTAYKIIQSSNSYDALFDYLYELEVHHMGLKGNRKKTEECAKNLFCEVKPNFR
jgi:hypothetical protein